MNVLTNTACGQKWRLAVCKTLESLDAAPGGKSVLLGKAEQLLWVSFDH